MDFDLFSEGKEYISASRAAKKIGYTSDYLGQLCRANKISGKLVGRTWYVDYASLLEHKKNQELAKVKSLPRPEAPVAAKAREAAPVKTFQNLAVAYEADYAPRIPELVKPIALPASRFAKRTVLRAVVGTLALIVAVGSSFLTVDKVAPSLARNVEEKIGLVSSFGTELLGNASGAQVAAASFFDALAGSVEFFVDGFKSLRNIAFGTDAPEEIVTTSSNRVAFVTAPAEPKSTGVTQAVTVARTEAPVTESKSQLQAELEAYVRTQISAIAEPRVVYNTFNNSVLRNEILTSDTRPTVTRQSDSDADNLGQAIYALTEKGIFRNSLMTNATVMGPVGGFESLGFGLATGTNATTTNFFSTNATFGSLTGGSVDLSNLLFTNATGTNATSTNSFATTASSTNLFSTNATFGTLSASSATFADLLLNGAAVLQNFTFAQATGTAATTTNFFSTKGTFDELYVNDYQQNDGTFNILSSVTTGDVFSVYDSAIGNGTLIHQSLTANAGNGQVSKGQAIDLVDATTAGGGYSALEINVTGAGIGSGSKTLLSLNPGGNNTVVFDSTGAFRPTTSAASNANSLGSPSYYWKNAYVDTLTANNLSGTVVSGATSNNTWTVGSTEASDAYKALVFQRNSGSGNALFQWNAGAGDARYLSVNYPFNSTYTVDDASIGVNVNLYSGALTNNTTSGTQNLLSLTNTGTGSTERGIYLNNTGTGTTGFEIAGTWTNGILTNNNTINTGSGNITSTGTGSLGNLLVTGSSTLQNFTFVNATGTNATTTSLFSTTASSTNLFSTNANLGSAIFGNSTTTNATTTNFFSTNANFTTLTSASQTLTDLLFTRATGTSATTTSFFSTTASSTNLFSTNAALGSATISSLTSGRVPFASTGGLLADSASLLWDNTLARLTLTNIVSTNSTSTNATTTSLYAGGQTILAATSGNVGIGTTNPAAADGSSKTLQIGNTVAMQNVVGTQALYGNNVHYDGSWKYITSSEAAAMRIYSGDIVFHTGLSGPAGTTVSGWDSTGVKMIIKNGGNVGIGTNNPATLLDVAGVTTFRGNIIAGTDNTYDIGASGATRPRTGYFGTSVVTPAATISGVLNLSGTNQIHQLSGHNFVQGDAATTYLYGGTSGIQFRKSDNASALMTISDTGNWTLLGGSTINSAGTISLNGTSFTTVGGAITFPASVIHQVGTHNFFQGDATNTYLYGGTSGLHFRSADNSTALIDISNTGNLTFATDNTQDIGASGATRPRNLYLGSTLTVGSTSTLGSTVTFGAATNGGTADWDATNFTVAAKSGKGLLLQSNAGTGTNGIAILSGGNVGIGTTNPASKLDISGGLILTTGTAASIATKGLQIRFDNTNNTGHISASHSGVANYPLYLGGDGFTASNGIYIDGVGNVGLNTSSPVTYGTFAVRRAVTGIVSGFGVSGSFSDNANATVSIVTGATSLGGLFSDNNLVLGAGNSEKIRILSSNGNVGIGSTNPASKLDVNGGIRATLDATGANTGQIVTMKSDGTLTTDSSTFTWDSSNDLLSVNGLNIYSTGVRAAGSNDLQLGSANTFPSIVIRGSNGNVGVGSSTPLAKLSVKGSGTTTGINFQTTNSSDSPLFTILDSGNVGIGTTNPTSKLSVNGTIKATAADAGTHQYAIMADPSAISGTTQSNLFYAGGTIAAATAVTERAGLRIDSSGLGAGASIATQYGIYIANQTGATTNYGLYSAGANKSYFAGNVGIGTTNPGTALEVNGSITAQGSVIFKDANNANTYGLRGLTGIITADGGSVFPTGWNFQYGGTSNSALYINSGGSVGIGTTNPGYPLQVSAARSASTDMYALQATGSGVTGDQINLLFRQNTGADASIYTLASISSINETSAGASGALAFSTRTSGSTFTEKMRISSGGNLSVTALTSCGGIQTNGSGTMSCTSDERLKDVQSSFTTGLDAIMGITPQTYSWKADSDLYDGGLLYSGFIAQNIQANIPEAVNTNAKGYLQINTTSILAASINAIKELNINVEAHYTELTNISVELQGQAARIGVLESKVANIEAQLGGISTSTASSTEALAPGFLDGIWDALVSRLASAANGIGDFFANRVKTKELCISDENGETCITKAALDALMANVGGSVPSGGAPSGGENSGGGEVGGGEAEGGTDGGVVEETPPVDEGGAGAGEEVPPQDGGASGGETGEPAP